jgi:hypothetical protein
MKKKIHHKSYGRGNSGVRRQETEWKKEEYRRQETEDRMKTLPNPFCLLNSEF